MTGIDKTNRRPVDRRSACIHYSVSTTQYQLLAILISIYSRPASYCGNCLILVTLSPVNRTKTVRSGGVP